MERITRAALDQFVMDQTVLIGKPGRPALARTSDGRIAKFFYRRKIISTSLIIPQVERFRRNGIKLASAGFAAPLVDEIMYCRAIPVHVALYPFIDGSDLRALSTSGDEVPLQMLPAYLASLHQNGIYFRAIHLANVLQLTQGGLGILDIADLKVHSRELTSSQRARNLAHLFSNAEDKEILLGYGLRRFVDEYLHHARLSGSQIARLARRLNRGVTPAIRDQLERNL